MGALARELSATNIQEAMCSAEPRTVISRSCVNAVGMGTTEYNGTMRQAARSGHLEILRQCWEWGAIDYDQVMCGEALRVTSKSCKSWE